MDTLQIIQLIFSIITGGFAVLTLVCKPFRDWLLKKRKDEEDKRETDKCLLRDRITEIYYTHIDNKSMREYEFENLSHLYTQYKKLKGNSFVDKIWNEMQSWGITL